MKSKGRVFLNIVKFVGNSMRQGYGFVEKPLSVVIFLSLVGLFIAGVVSVETKTGELLTEAVSGLSNKHIHNEENKK